MLSNLERPRDLTIDERWPPLPFREWSATRETLHMWTQIVGKLKVELAPFQNQLWHTALHPTARGLTTMPIPCSTGVFQADFDFIEHDLILATSDGRRKVVPLYPRTVADFYRETMACLRTLGIGVSINTAPQEVPNPIPFEEDATHASYDVAAVGRWFRAMTSTSRVLWEHRTWFVGKASPVHFFWGSFDLTASRFSGDRASVPAGRDFVYRVAENEANWSGGFWPGSAPLDYPAFYAYFVPEPRGFPEASVLPSRARWVPEARQFILPYEAVRTADDPERTLLAFFETTYRAGAELAGWRRNELELPEIPRPR